MMDGKPRITGNQPVEAVKLTLSRELRDHHTPAERVAWRILRNRGVLDLKFRRQQVIDGFVVDFYCPSERLVIEVDGSVHNSDQQKEYDDERTRLLNQRGLHVIRVGNDEINSDQLVRRIKHALGR